MQDGDADDFLAINRLEIGQIGYKVVDKPAVASDEFLWFGVGGVLSEAYAVAERVVGHDFVVPYSKALSGAAEIEVLGSDAEYADVNVDILIPFVDPGS